MPIMHQLHHVNKNMLMMRMAMMPSETDVAPNANDDASPQVINQMLRAPLVLIMIIMQMMMHAHKL